VATLRPAFRLTRFRADRRFLFSMPIQPWHFESSAILQLVEIIEDRRNNLSVLPFTM
jgi:hypothetical protein